MRQTQENRHVGTQIRLTGMPVLTFGLLVVICLGHQAARAQSPIGAAESCFDAGPDRVPAFAVTPVPPVRPGLSAKTQPYSAAAAPAAKLVPAGLTPLRPMPIQLLNAGNKDRWTPPLRKSPEYLAAAR